jgi:hypothetical protein
MDAAIDRDEAKDIRAGEDENVRLPLLEEEEEEVADRGFFFVLLGII